MLRSTQSGTARRLRRPHDRQIPGVKILRHITERNEWLRKRAYALWEAAGRPDGKDAEHWHQAVEERDALERSQATVDGAEIIARLQQRAVLDLTPEEVKT